MCREKRRTFYIICHCSRNLLHLQFPSTRPSLSSSMAERQRQQEPPSPAMLEAVEEIMAIYRSLPPRPTIEEVEAANSILDTVNAEEATQIEDLSKLKNSSNVPEEISSVLREMKMTMIMFQSHELRKDALFIVESDKLFHVFDGLIQRASEMVYGGSEEQNTVKIGHYGGEISGCGVGQGEVSLLVKKFVVDSVSDEGLRHLTRNNSSNAVIPAEGNYEKLSMMKVAALIEKSAKNKSTAFDLKGKLMDQIEWLPVSIGKLLDIISLDLSENHIMALPNSIGNLKHLIKLDVHSNQIINLPESIGELTNLTHLDCHANRMRSLPSSLPNLTSLQNFDLSSNEFTQLPEAIGSLTSLQKLNVETNDLEDLPYAIGSCSALIELKLDFNRLRALPEAIGKLGSLETLSLHYNKIKGLPTTVGNLSSLRELDLSFNELESVPESLCFAVRLVKLNVGKNFADLRALPQSIGNLEMLEELDISDNQIRVLPESFRLLSRLRVLRADETPLELPPKETVKLGAQAVVEFMSDYVRNLKLKQQLKKKKKGFWFQICCFICLNGGANKN